MLDILSLHKYFLSPHIKKGGTAVDFTMGNGYDTQYLSEEIGEGGKVFAFDVQDQALINTENRLMNSNCPQNWILIKDSHEKAPVYVKAPICAGIFNLGWLPGSDKSCTTRRETTVPAVRNAINMLDNGGILLIAVYPGHEEGKHEGEAIASVLEELSKYHYCAAEFKLINSPSSPYFFIVEKK